MHGAPHTSVLDTSRACRAVAIGASAGGIRALQQVLGALPTDFAVPVVVVLHLQPDHASVLASVLGSHTPLRVKAAERGEAVTPGTVYVGVPNLHLEVVDGRVVLAATPEVHFSRPSVDVLFRSMAAQYGASLCGVILSGAGRDGADGLAVIKAA